MVIVNNIISPFTLISSGGGFLISYACPKQPGACCISKITWPGNFSEYRFPAQLVGTGFSLAP